MEDVKVIELPEKDSIDPVHYLITETDDGTRKVQAKYLRSLIATSFVYDTIDDLKASETQLVEGDICVTLGYHEKGDGGGSRYVITYNPGIAEDGMKVHYLSFSDTLRAEIILTDTVNVHQFGAYGDGSHDDITAIQSAIDTGLSVKFNTGKKYVVRTPIILNKSGIILEGNNAIIVPKFVYAFEIGLEEENINNITLRDFIIDSYDSTMSLSITNVDDCILDCVKLFNSNKAIKCVNSIVIINDSYIIATKDSKNSVGITIDGDDIYRCNVSVNDTIFEYMNTCIYVHSSGIDGHIINTRNITLKNMKSDSIFANVMSNTSAFTIENYRGHENTKILYAAEVADKIHIDIRNIYEFADEAISSISYNSVMNISGYVHNSIERVIPNSIDSDKPVSVLSIEDDNDGIYNSRYGVLFGQISGTLYTNVSWTSMNPPYYNGDIEQAGTLVDFANPLSYDEEISIFSNSVWVSELRNAVINLCGNSNLEEINGGMNGQIIMVRSENNKSVCSKELNIELKEASVPLGPYTYVTLKRIGNIWTQIG